MSINRRLMLIHSLVSIVKLFNHYDDTFDHVSITSAMKNPAACVIRATCFNTIVVFLRPMYNLNGILK